MAPESNLHEMNNFNDQAKEHKSKLENEEKIEKAAETGDPKASGKDGNNYIDENTTEPRMKDMENDGGGFGRNNGSDMSGR